MTLSVNVRQPKWNVNRDNNKRMLLAADVGGTKTLLGLFARAPERPRRIEVGEFITLDYDDLVPMIREFLKANGLEARAI